MKATPYVTSTLCVVAVAVALTAHAYGARDLFVGGLWVGSAHFVGTAYANGATKSRPGLMILAALIACAAGDYLGPGNFELGVAAFAVAHLLFTVAFVLMGLSWKRVLPAAGFTLCTGMLTVAWLWPHLDSVEHPLVLGYTVVISLMLIGALSVRPGRGTALIVVAALTFYVSDLFVARWRFVDGSSANAYFCYPLYYAACLMFAWVPRYLTTGAEAKTGDALSPTSS